MRKIFQSFLFLLAFFAGQAHAQQKPHNVLFVVIDLNDYVSLLER
jgi:hypothetical protein